MPQARTNRYGTRAITFIPLSKLFPSSPREKNPWIELLSKMAISKRKNLTNFSLLMLPLF